jgi:hypothetical protein
VAQYCIDYFHRNPYDAWFKRLDAIVAGAGGTYYGMASSACHLDLVPYATALKWAALMPRQRVGLLDVSREMFLALLRDSPIEVLILNGRAVIEEFERVTPGQLESLAMPDWTLPRRSVPGVEGRAMYGVVNSVGTVSLGRNLMVLGFNHNVQSSYGVTKGVLTSIREWVAEVTRRRGWWGRAGARRNV